MLLLICLIAGLVFAAAAVAVTMAMSRAERRARRALFRALGLDAATIELLMARNGDVLAELALVRRQDLSPAAAAEDPPSAGPPAPGHPPNRPAIRLVHPAPGAAAPSPPPDHPTGDRRRLPRRP